MKILERKERQITALDFQAGNVNLYYILIQSTKTVVKFVREFFTLQDIEHLYMYDNKGKLPPSGDWSLAK